MLSNDELVRISKEREKRLEELKNKYPRAITDEFQKACLQWELLYGERGSWVVICPNHDVEKTLNSFSGMFDPITGVSTGLGFQAVSDRPDGPPIGFHVMYYEKAKDLIKSKLMSMGIKESEITWISESEHRK